MNGHGIEAMLLVAVTVLIHGLGSFLIIRAMTNNESRREGWLRGLRSMLGLVHLVVSLVLIHMVEVGAWAAFYSAMGLFPDFKTALYYSLVTYTTVGYGDVLMPEGWRILGGCEALAGILMTAWSTAILIPAVSKIHQEQHEYWMRKRKEARRSKSGDAESPGSAK